MKIENIIEKIDSLVCDEKIKRFMGIDLKTVFFIDEEKAKSSGKESIVSHLACVKKVFNERDKSLKSLLYFEPAKDDFGNWHYEKTEITDEKTVKEIVEKVFDESYFSPKSQKEKIRNDIISEDVGIAHCTCTVFSKVRAKNACGKMETFFAKYHDFKIDIPFKNLSEIIDESNAEDRYFPARKRIYEMYGDKTSTPALKELSLEFLPQTVFPPLKLGKGFFGSVYDK